MPGPVQGGIARQRVLEAGQQLVALGPASLRELDLREQLEQPDAQGEQSGSLLQAIPAASRGPSEAAFRQVDVRQFRVYAAQRDGVARLSGARQRLARLPRSGGIALERCNWASSQGFGLARSSISAVRR